MTDVEALVLEPADFERVAARFPQVYRNLGTILAHKLARADRLAAGDAPGVLVHLRDHGGPPLAAYALACSIAWHTRENVLLLARDPERYRELAPFAGARRRARGRRPRRRDARGGRRRAGAPRRRRASLFARYATIVVLDRPAEAQLHTAVAVDLVAGRLGARPTRARSPSAPGRSRRDAAAVPDRIYDVPALAAADQAALRDGLLPDATRRRARRSAGWRAS